MTDPQPAGDAPDIAELKAMDPVARARAITALVTPRGNLTPELALMRVQALLEARAAEGRKVSWLAKHVGLGASGISRLTSPKHSVRKRLASEGATP